MCMNIFFNCTIFFSFINSLFYWKSAKFLMFYIYSLKYKFSLRLMFLKCEIPLRKYAIISPKTGKIREWVSKHETFRLLIFFKCGIHTYIFHKCTTISPKIGKIRDYCRNMNLFRGLYVLNVRFIYLFYFIYFLQKYAILPKTGKIRE